MVLAAEDGPWSQLRTGTVSSQDATAVTVLVGGTQVRAAYILGTTLNPGNLVAVLRQDATWFCLGRIAGQGPNEIQNPSFERDTPGTAPSMWFMADLVGGAQAVVAADATAPDGAQIAQVISDSAASQSYLYSSAIAATAGEVFNVSAFAAGFYPDDSVQNADAALVALWFANPDDLYPTTSAADTVIDTFTDVPSAPPWSQLSGSVTAPVSGFLRLALRTTMTQDQSMGWDFAIARRVG